MTGGDGWDAIFVGAGITSLACAALLVKRHPRLRLLIVDKHIAAGGYATNFRRPKPQATFDCSLHKLSGMGPGGNLMRIFRELGLDAQLDLTYPDDYFCSYRNGQALPLANDAGRMQQQLCEAFPHQVSALETFFEHVRTFGRNGYHQFQMMDGSFEPDMAQLRYAHKHLKHRTVREQLGDMFDDHHLIEILSAPGIYVGGHGEDLGYLYYLHVVYATLNQGNAYVLGSAQRLSDLLARRVQAPGGKVLLGTRVEKILVDADAQVTGVRTSKGDFLSDRVYVNASPHYALEHLFDERPGLDDVRARLGALKPARSTTTAYVVTDVPPRDLGLRHTESMVFDDTPGAAAPLRIAAAGNGHPEAESEIAFWHRSPMEVTNYHALDSSGGKVICLNVLDNIAHWPQRRTPAYRDKKRRAGETLLDRLDRQLRGLRGHVTYLEVSTPRTYVRFTNNTDGSGYGAMVGTDLSGHVFHHRFPVAGVQFLSAWVAGPSYEAAFGYAEMKARQWKAA